jgi:hypothetical protein
MNKTIPTMTNTAPMRAVLTNQSFLNMKTNTAEEIRFIACIRLRSLSSNMSAVRGDAVHHVAKTITQA